MVTVQELAPSWLPDFLAQAWYNEYETMGGASTPGAGQAASEMIRVQGGKYQSQYDKYFPGNRREDGSLRLSEQDYRKRTDSYENALLGVNVNPDLFAEQFGHLIQGDVGEAEFVNRVESMYERVIEAAPAIREFYADNFSRNMTDAAIVASFLDPDIGNAILDQRIAISEIGGEAASRGFDVDMRFASSLEKAGVSRTQAQDLFGQAALDVPVLNVLARRHADPDDDFDINEFTQGMVFDDPEQRRRMRRLVAQERSTFTGGAAGRMFEQDRETGGLTGLTAL
jgi:hypothetical protein